MIDIRKATHDDIEGCARVLALAFQDDPGTVHFEPDEQRRRSVLPSFFRTFVAASVAESADLMIAVDGVDGIDGIASWFGPERHGPSPDAMGAHGFGDVLALAGREAGERLLAMVGEIERQHSLLAGGPHLRLQFYGVAPERQGTGVGTALIEEGHRRADALRLPTYLETFSERNVGFYGRRGYAVAGAFTIGAGVPGWGMIRPPDTGQAVPANRR